MKVSNITCEAAHNWEKGTLEAPGIKYNFT